MCMFGGECLTLGSYVRHAGKLHKDWKGFWDRSGRDLEWIWQCECLRVSVSHYRRLTRTYKQKGPRSRQHRDDHFTELVWIWQWGCLEPFFLQSASHLSKSWNITKQDQNAGDSGTGLGHISASSDSLFCYYCFSATLRWTSQQSLTTPVSRRLQHDREVFHDIA